MVRIFFAGTPRFAVNPLKAIAGQFEVCGVLSAPDKPAGRGRKIKISPVKEAVRNLNLTIFQPLKIDSDFRRQVEKLNADILVVAAFHKIFKKDFLDIFPMGGLNIHPSLLPLHRGPAPIQASILAGDQKTGVSVQELALKMDEGDILAREEFPLTGLETASELDAKSSEIGARLIVNVLHEIEQGIAVKIPQDNQNATYCKLIKKTDGHINWPDSAGRIERMIRAYHEWPRAYTFYKGQRLYLLAGGVLQTNKNMHNGGPGKVLDVHHEHGILIKTGEGILSVVKLQLHAKKALFWKDFINGQKEFIGATLGG